MKTICSTTNVFAQAAILAERIVRSLEKWELSGRDHLQDTFEALDQLVEAFPPDRVDLGTMGYFRNWLASSQTFLEQDKVGAALFQMRALGRKLRGLSKERISRPRPRAGTRP